MVPCTKHTVFKLSGPHRWSLHTEPFAWRQAVQRSPLCKTAAVRGPNLSDQQSLLRFRSVRKLTKSDC